MKPAKVIIALGGNIDSAIGGPALTIRAALERLGDSQLSVEATSRLFATPCFPKGAGPDYVNAAAVLSGLDDPHEILRVLHRVEAAFGRERLQRWGRRTLDLDLIAVGDRVLPDLETFQAWRSLPPEAQVAAVPDRLILPHPRLQDRAFVLVPLAEIAPNWWHPVLGRSVVELVAELPGRETANIRRLDTPESVPH
ncbi:MAG: 2-amino-4-hydroxy-6-hydroxymethyldihydropteridine diphosphokinase [Rhodobacter sp.]|nr:2-amino-4-hydroxy-6-hydroxymethyldihydropteridine diphosphokinase [Rhodobacter sp.]